MKALCIIHKCTCTMACDKFQHICTLNFSKSHCELHWIEDQQKKKNYTGLQWMMTNIKLDKVLFEILKKNINTACKIFFHFLTFFFYFALCFFFWFAWKKKKSNKNNHKWITWGKNEQCSKSKDHRKNAKSSRANTDL